jgi:hypothetical protein
MVDTDAIEIDSIALVHTPMPLAEYANRWALTHGETVPYPALRDTQRAPVPATWGKRRLEVERAAVARQLARHRVACSQCAAARGDLTRSCQQGYDLARQHGALTDAWWQAKGRQPASSTQGGLW